MADKDSKKKPNPTDVHVGGRIRLRRNMLNMSQERLGEKLGITFQQIQKYEKGTNRVGASRLQAIASILGVPPAFFFEGLSGQEGETSGVGFAEEGHAALLNLASAPEGLELIRAFSRIEDRRVRNRLLELIKTLSKSGD